MTFRCIPFLFYYFVVMRRNIDRAIVDLEEGTEALKVIEGNMRNID